MSMLGHYTKLFQELGHIEIRDSQAGDWPEDWEYTITKKNTTAPKGVIHVGCHDCPERGCYVPLFGHNVVWIEANRDSFYQWVKPVAEKYKHWAFNLAASNTTGTGYYFDNGSPETSGLLPLKDGQCNFTVLEEKKLDDLVEEYNIDMNNFDFLNVDVEGAELKVLEGFEKHIDKIRFLFLEVSTYEKTKGQPLFDDVTQYVEQLGFKLYRVSDSINTLGWGDAFYVRD